VYAVRMNNEIQEKIKQTALVVVRDVCALKKGERVLIITNPENDTLEISRRLYEAADELGGKAVIFIGAFTIFCAVMMHQLFHLPAMWGMMFGFSLLSLYTYYFKKAHKNEEPMHVFHYMSKIENNTLFFFFGILAAVGALHFAGFLNYAVSLYDKFGSTAVNIGVGFLSAIVDNVPVMSAVLKANPAMGADAILLITEWKEFRLPSWDVVSKIMNKPLLIDGRNIFDRSELESVGFEYHCIGC